MKNIPEILKINKINAELILQVHDELIFECIETEVDRLIPIVKSIMIDAPNPAFKMTVPLEVEAGVGNNWDEAH
jgi:DNA polymerase-1